MEDFSPEDEIESDSEELFEHYKIDVDKGQVPVRIDKFLMDRLPNTSRNKIQIACKNGSVRVHQSVVKSNYKVKPGDLVTIVLPYPVREIELIPQDIPIEIVYEDDEVIVVNKPAAMVVHPGYGNYSGTLVNALLFHFSQLPQNKDGLNDRPGLVHRIDKNTTGILVVAKTEYALSFLAKQFFERTSDRRYQALVWGNMEEDEGTITGNIGRSLKNRKVMDVFPNGDFGKHAVTHYKVISRLGYVTLVECKLETGRTHQIRAHFKHIGHPLFNDNEYGGDKILKGTTFTKYKQFVENCFELLPGQALHAKSLAFFHPKTEQWMAFDSQLPENFVKLIDKWEKYGVQSV
jgi:23S rRNA pseudouridine1911/1915/1917 synthase